MLTASLFVAIFFRSIKSAKRYNLCDTLYTLKNLKDIQSRRRFAHGSYSRLFYIEYCTQWSVVHHLDDATTFVFSVLYTPLKKSVYSTVLPSSLAYSQTITHAMLGVFFHM